MAGQTAPASAGHKLSLLQILAFAIPAIPGAALAVMMGQFMPRYFAMHAGISLLAVGAAISSARLLDTFVELPLGWAMDHTNTPFGRYRPWYILGVPVLALSVYMLFIHTDGLTAAYIAFWYLVLSFGSSLTNLAHGAWAATLATDYHQRSRVFGWMTAVGTMGSVGLLALPILTHGAVQPGRGGNVAIIGWGIIFSWPILAMLTAVVSSEPKTRTVDRGKVGLRDYWSMIARPTALRLILGDLFLTLGPALTSPIYVFFFHEVKHFSVGAVTTLLIFYIGASLVGAPIWARIARSLGKHRTLQLGALLYAVAQTILMIMPAGTYWPHAIGMFAVGFCNCAFALMIRAMLADYSDELRLEQGVQRVSLLYSFVGVTLKVGTSLNVFISFAILEMVGFQAHEGAVNTPQAIFGLEMVYLFAPIIFVFLGGCFFFGYKLDETRHAEIRAELDARDATEAEGRLMEASA